MGEGVELGMFDENLENELDRAPNSGHNAMDADVEHITNVLSSKRLIKIAYHKLKTLLIVNNIFMGYDNCLFKMYIVKNNIKFHGIPKDNTFIQILISTTQSPY